MDNAGTTPDIGSLSRKVISIAAGEAHTLALTGDGSVYSWGRGTFGRLGTGSESDQLLPVRIEFQSSDERLEQERLNIVSIAGGAYHSLALADDGSVWSWGYNTYGQLGTGGENSLVPCQLEQFFELGSISSLTEDTEVKIKTPLKVSSVKAGGMMSLAIDTLGILWMWGNCPQQSNSSEEEFSLISSFNPIPVRNFYGHTVVKVACGNEHIVALVHAKETYEGSNLVCYSWGNNNHGQLGLGDDKSRLHPQEVELFNHESSWVIYEVACGAFHTALLAREERESDMSESTCWTFGLGDNGQLGHGTTKSMFLPEPVRGLPKKVFLVSIDCGFFHTSVVSSAGDVWSWGMEKGLGLCPDASFTGTDAGDAVSPRLLGVKFTGPVQVACGAAHTVLVADDGYKLWSWGRGRSGVLGNGKTLDFFAPSVVSWPPPTEYLKGKEKSEEKDSEGSSEMGRELAKAMEEIELVRSKLAAVEKYAEILHGAIFGKPLEEGEIPVSLKNFGVFDVAKEWDNMLESADRRKLLRMEMFYRNMLAGVKDTLMKRRVQELVKECVSLNAGNSQK